MDVTMLSGGRKNKTKKSHTKKSPHHIKDDDISKPELFTGGYSPKRSKLTSTKTKKRSSSSKKRKNTPKKKLLFF